MKILIVVFAAVAVIFLVLWIRSVQKLQKYSVMPPLILKQHADSSTQVSINSSSASTGGEFACYPSILIDTDLPMDQQEEVQLISAFGANKVKWI